MRKLADYALYRLTLWWLSHRDDPAIKELSRQVLARRRQHKRVYADIQRIRHARMKAQKEASHA